MTRNCRDHATRGARPLECELTHDVRTRFIGCDDDKGVAAGLPQCPVDSLHQDHRGWDDQSINAVLQSEAGQRRGHDIVSRSTGPTRQPLHRASG